MRRRHLLIVLLLLLLGATGIVVGVVATGPSSEDASEQRDDAKGSAVESRTKRRRVRADAGAETDTRATPRPVEAADAPDASSVDAEGEDGGATTPDGAADDEAPLHEVGARVLDAASGEPLANARVLVTKMRGTEFVSWWGVETDADGRFAQELPARVKEDGTRLELRIAKTGYVSTVVPLTEGPLEVSLMKRDSPAIPGRITGTATDLNGRPITGKLLVYMQDAMRDGFAQWVIPDAGGRFVMQGVPPGHWLVRAYPDGEGALAIVPDGGETPVHLRRKLREWPPPMTEEEFARRHAELRVDGGPRRTDQAGEEAEYDRIFAMQTLETEWRALRPTREVVVGGVPEGEGVHLRAAVEFGPQHVWTARADGGEARFEALSLEAWRIILVRPGEPEITRELELEAGEGPHRLSFSSED